MSSQLKPVSFEPLEKNADGPVIGLDEAGRGCLAGPVAVGFAVFPPELFQKELPDSLKMVRDSKLLNRSRRESLVEPIQKYSLCSGVIMASARSIDGKGINPTIENCMIQALARVRRQIQPVATLIDGNYRLTQLKSRNPDLRVECLVGGDNRVFSIAAASILAKVFRDKRMDRFDRYFPGYDFSRHAGYGTAHHRQKIHELGLSPLHRKSYKLKS